MKLVLMGLLSLVALSCILFLVREYIANSLVSDPKNVKQLIKHYGAEGINVHHSPHDRTFEVFFFHKGADYRRSIGYYDAFKWMNMTPKEKGGIRALLVRKFS